MCVANGAARVQSVQYSDGPARDADSNGRKVVRYDLSSSDLTYFGVKEAVRSSLLSKLGRRAGEPVQFLSPPLARFKEPQYGGAFVFG